MLILIPALNILATSLMTGLIWFVQLVHYPLFREVGADCFVKYEQQHAVRTTWITFPVMLTELVTSVGMVVLYGNIVWWIMLGLTLGTWIVTVFVSVPYHRMLSQRFEERPHHKLLTTNWLRTILWTARLAIWILIVVEMGSKVDAPFV